MSGHVRQETGYWGQTFCVEYIVTDSLDGTTIQPAVEAPRVNADPQGIYRADPVANLGLIDPDYVVTDGEDNQGAAGPRWITFLWIRGPFAVGELGKAAVEIVDAVKAPSRLQETIFFSPVPVTSFYDQGIRIPQGSLLRLRGWQAVPGTPIVVRLHIIYLGDVDDVMDAAAIECKKPSNLPDFRRSVTPGILVDVDTGNLPIVTLVPLPLDPNAFWLHVNGKHYPPTNSDGKSNYALNLATGQVTWTPASVNALTQAAPDLAADDQVQIIYEG